MRYFSPTSFERLLFPIPKSFYRDIENELSSIEETQPGSYRKICERYCLVFSKPTTVNVTTPSHLEEFRFPDADIYIQVEGKNLSRLRRPPNFRTGWKRHDEIHAGKGVHLIVDVYTGKKRFFYMIPLWLVFRAFEGKVCRPGAFQIYEHTFIRKKPLGMQADSVGDYIRESATYIGLTKRTWQGRYKEHEYAARRGSHLRFHKALRGELFPVEIVEHQVLRAGLTEDEALHIEESDVEERTLYPSHANGLNMIPGGKAGIRFMAYMTKKKPSEIDADGKERELELIVNDNLRQQGIKARNTYTNDRLAELWREDIKFRITAMTNRIDRLSYQQIFNARIWHASGWGIEKIHAHLLELEDRSISRQQVERLLTGKTYDSIPHVFIEVGG